MTREVYTDPEVINFSRGQVFLRVFQDTQAEGARLARKFRVRGYPTFVILDSQGREVDRILGAMSPEDLIDELKEIFESTKGGKYNI